MKQNPFSLQYGRMPEWYVQRNDVPDQIIQSFERGQPAVKSCVVSGLRGMGKTVTLNSVSDYFRDKNWIVISLNPYRDMLESFGACLYHALEADENKESSEYSRRKLNLRSNDIEMIDEHLLVRAKENFRQVLITIDDIVYTDHVLAFFHFLNRISPEDYPLCILMSALWQNVSDSENDRIPAFVMRSEKVILGMLDTDLMTEYYRQIFSVSRRTAARFTDITFGYPYAFQVLGYYIWEYPDDFLDNNQKRMNRHLREQVYRVILHEQKEQDRKLLKSAAGLKYESRTPSAVRNAAGLSEKAYSSSAERLLSQSLIAFDEDDGLMFFNLPGFSKAFEK